MAATRPSGHFSLPREALEHQNRGPYNLAVSTTLLVLATVFVILRVVARRMKKIWGWEDWFCIAALVSHQCYPSELNNNFFFWKLI